MPAGGDVTAAAGVHVPARDPAAKTVLSPDLADTIENYWWFVGAADRDSVKVGLNYHVPSYFHQIPRLVEEYMDTDVAMATVSPMDKAGFFEPRDGKRLFFYRCPYLQETHPRSEPCHARAW